MDEDAERSDVVGYAPSTEFSYDRHTNTPVHDRLSEIHDKELLGDDAHVDIVSVDLFTADNRTGARQQNVLMRLFRIQTGTEQMR